MTPEQIKKAAADLFQAEKTQKQINLLTADYPDMQMDNAYAVQEALVNLKTLGGLSLIHISEPTRLV